MSRIFSQMSHSLLAATPISTRIRPSGPVLLTNISPSHPAPFKYTIRPRSEKTAALIASVEL